MSDNTKIEWADATLNYANGCSLASPGCTNCYAMKQAHRFPVRQGLTVQSKGGMVWTGEVRINDKALHQALAWKRGRRIFWNAHGDLFHEKVTDEQIDHLFAVCALTPQHTHMILTKRSARMRDYANRRGASPSLPSHEIMAAMDGLSRSKWPDLHWPLPNVWLGVSVEDQTRADERIPDLLATPAAVRFLSCEPLLGPVDLTMLDATVSEKDQAEPSGLIYVDALTGVHRDAEDSIEGVYGSPDPRIDWIIAGGESGPNARSMHPDWARSLRDQCAAAGVPFFFKQWGEWLPCEWCDESDGRGIVCYPEDGSERDMAELKGRRPIQNVGNQPMWRVGKKLAGRLLDGVEHNGMPGDRANG